MMNTFSNIMRVFVMIALILTIACSEETQLPFASAPAAEKARDFVLKDLNGRNFTLSEQKGRPVLLIFSTTWCPGCRSEIPYFKSIYDTYGKKGLAVVNIDIQEPRDKVLRFAERYQLPYRVLLDEHGLVAKSYQIVGVPTLILIDAEGNIISRNYQEITGLLGRIFKGA